MGMHAELLTTFYVLVGRYCHVRLPRDNQAGATQSVSHLQSQEIWLFVDMMGILFGRDTMINGAFNAWCEEIKQSGESVLSMALKKRYDDLLGEKNAAIATRDKLLSGTTNMHPFTSFILPSHAFTSPPYILLGT